MIVLGVFHQHIGVELTVVKVFKRHYAALEWLLFKTFPLLLFLHDYTLLQKVGRCDLRVGK